MKRIVFALLLALFLPPVFAAGPTKYIEYDVSVEVFEDYTVTETVNLQFEEEVDTFNYYVLHPLENVGVFAGGKEIDCDRGREVRGTQITCEGFRSSEVTLKMDYYGLIEKRGGFLMVYDTYIFSTPSDRFRFGLTLPRGYVIAENVSELDLFPYSPADAVQSTDGRRISLIWEREPALGETFSFYVVYEQVFEPERDNTRIYVLLLLAVIIILAGLYFRRKPTLKEYGLNDDERKILNVLLKENRISQKKIARETGFSKAHVSRLAKDMEERGLIRRKKTGRTYEVILKK
ncbi:MAG: helix-turn-helix transcriptional regulator [Candidatus Aenigmatarchaeota archaeon]